LDHICDSLDYVAAGIDVRIHHGWSHSYPPGHRNRSGAYPGYSRPQTSVTILDLAEKGEVFTERRKLKVQLSGFVGSEKAIDKAVQTAGSVKGVVSVKNSLIVK
jgi:hypothetical protein